jgi:hypothetical protein
MSFIERSLKKRRRGKENIKERIRQEEEGGGKQKQKIRLRWYDITLIFLEPIYFSYYLLVVERKMFVEDSDGGERERKINERNKR